MKGFDNGMPIVRASVDMRLVPWTIHNLCLGTQTFILYNHSCFSVMCLVILDDEGEIFQFAFGTVCACIVTARRLLSHCVKGSEEQSDLVCVNL